MSGCPSQRPRGERQVDIVDSPAGAGLGFQLLAVLDRFDSKPSGPAPAPIDSRPHGADPHNARPLRRPAEGGGPPWAASEPPTENPRALRARRGSPNPRSSSATRTKTDRPHRSLRRVAPGLRPACHGAGWPGDGRAPEPQRAGKASGCLPSARERQPAPQSAPPHTQTHAPSGSRLRRADRACVRCAAGAGCAPARRHAAGARHRGPEATRPGVVSKGMYGGGGFRQVGRNLCLCWRGKRNQSK